MATLQPTIVRILEAVRIQTRCGRAGHVMTVRRAVLKTIGALLALCGMGVATSLAVTQNPRRMPKWIAFYGETADEEILARYDIVILDTGFKGSIERVAATGATVCAYLSLGEIRTSSSIFNLIDTKILLEQKPNWPGTFRLDVRQASWRALVLDRLIPAIRDRGFTGLLYDTLDTPPYLEQLDPEGRRGLGSAAADLVRAIRMKYPDMLLLMNRGYALLPTVVRYIDGVVAESLMTSFDQRQLGGYKWNEMSEVAAQQALLNPAYRHGTTIPILSLDYWEPDDTNTIKEIYARERRNGYCPYVGTPLLDTIVPEPT